MVQRDYKQQHGQEQQQYKLVLPWNCEHKGVAFAADA